ncbi:MAG: hypothetical protein B9S34_03550 [Opitutia bacterium Tous-C1TDCM]|nr:MAG: hypothetical protein B9S34_03550 [Opitutae bacterium Tous-C1TDCM]
MHASLDGLWQPTSAEFSGAKAPAEILERTELELSLGRYTVRFGGESSDAGIFTGDAFTLTLLSVEGTNAGRTIPCVYQLKGDLLRICFGLDGTRPPAFATVAGDQRYLVTYRRRPAAK